ncbi:hypothetical protein GH714_019021 [Hevea brasiliensis]|uniref:Protein kinase domain-containing protein n=1 Tax=Hevea brasiliensis TaxID=3981 RepID=A0A6A6LTT8_HEVBR|nr:hypothetical protein GH714_019021 [Hevea brasiliensis]
MITNITSWKSDNDPSIGDFTAAVLPQTPPQAFAWKGSKPYFRSGPWDKTKFIGIPETEFDYQSGLALIEGLQPGIAYITKPKHFDLAAPIDTSIENSQGIMWRSPSEDEDSVELPLDFHSILVATNNFDMENKLGQGGYGPIYKGTLQDGKVVAIKRLSSSSSQGTGEFKNEMKLISKLQHINLVRLLEFLF